MRFLVMMLAVMTVFQFSLFAADPVLERGGNLEMMELDDGNYGLEGASGVNPFSRSFSLFQAVVFSAACGALVLCKFMLDVIRAYWSPDRQVESMKRAVARALLVVFVVLFTLVVFHMVTGL